MSFHKGQILTYQYPERVVKQLNASKVLKDYHRVVVLHTRTTPYNVSLVAPITSASALKKAGKIPINYVELKKDNYPFALDDDSYINLDMAMPVDNDELKDLERFGKKITVSLNDDDHYELDYKLTLTYELKDYISKELAEELETIVAFIDSEIRKKVRNLLEKIKDPEIMQVLMEIIDNDLIGMIKAEYIDKKLS